MIHDRISVERDIDRGPSGNCLSQKQIPKRDRGIQNLHSSGKTKNCPVVFGLFPNVSARVVLASGFAAPVVRPHQNRCRS